MQGALGLASSLILITAGYSNEQVAPAFGIFGTIVGYMLGRMNDPRPSDGAGQNNQQQAPAPPPPTPPSPPAGP